MFVWFFFKCDLESWQNVGNKQTYFGFYNRKTDPDYGGSYESNSCKRIWWP